MQFKKSLSITGTVVATLLAQSVRSASAAVIDNFSSSTATDSPNYNDYQWYSAGGQSSAFNIDPSGTFAPTVSGSGANTEYYYRNNHDSIGYAMGSAGGDTVSIQVTSLVSGANDAAGLVFTNSDTSAPTATNSFTILLLRGGNYSLDVNGPTYVLSGTFSNPETITVTRETGANSNKFDYSESGGLTGVSGTFTAPSGFTTSSTVYFGMANYTGSSSMTEGQKMTNLTFISATPEPATAAIFGFAAIGGLGRRRHRTA